MLNYNPYPITLLIVAIPYLLCVYILARIFCRIFKIQLSFLEILTLGAVSYIIHVAAFYFMMDVFGLDHTRYYNISLGARFVLNFTTVFYIIKDDSRISTNIWRSVFFTALLVVLSFVTDIAIDKAL